MPCWLSPSPDNPLACAIAQLEWLRVAAALLAGYLLGVAGCLTQWVFRNPLAEPYVLGVTGGASLAGALALLAGWPLWAVSGASLFGALSLLALVLWVAQRLDALQTVLWGVMVSTVCGAAVVALMALVPDSNLRGLVFWLMGDLGGVVDGWDLLIPGLAVALCSVYLGLAGVDLARLQLGDVLAQAVGVNVRLQRRSACVAAGIAVAAAFGIAGGVGFVGLIAPLLMQWAAQRFAIALRHVLWLSGLSGGLLVLVADQAAMRVFAPQVLPVGSVLGVLGAATMLTVLLRRSHV
jgi:iron complex transport system permease protein